MAGDMTASKRFFATFDVTNQVFFASRLSLGIVNLKPLLPGHVLILPKRVVPRLTDLRPDEVSDLFLSVQIVGRALERGYKAQALTISLQDGAVAGQSVPHVHIHVLPRHPTDYEGDNDRIYPALEEHEKELKAELSRKDEQTGNGISGGSAWRVPKDEDRQPRTAEEMEAEARWIRTLLPPAAHDTPYD